MIPDLPSPPSQSRSTETLWSRAIFFFGMVLLVSFGLCGLSFVAVLGINGAIRGSESAHSRQAISRTLIGFGYVELFGMAIGLIGIVVSFIGAAITSFTSRRKP